MFGCYNRGMQRTPIAAELAERRDHSITGMRIELPDNDALPEQVQVLIGKLSHKARTVWRKGNVVGIDFIDEHHSIF